MAELEPPRRIDSHPHLYQLRFHFRDIKTGEDRNIIITDTSRGYAATRAIKFAEANKWDVNITRKELLSTAPNPRYADYVKRETSRLGLPVKLPRFTTPEFEYAKSQYNAQYGYKVEMPGFDDIVHLWIPYTATPEEFMNYKARQYDKIDPQHLVWIRERMAAKRARYIQALASPTPNWAKNLGSVMTFIDDTEDAITVGIVIGRYLAKQSPKIFSRMLGVLGAALVAQDILNIASWIGRAFTLGAKYKTAQYDWHALNPFSKKAKLKRAAKLARKIPRVGEIIEILQVMDNVLGVGLCLGPIMGFASDMMHGTYRKIKGEKVEFLPLRDPPRWHEEKLMNQLIGAGEMFYAEQDLSDMDHFKALLAYQLALQGTEGYVKQMEVDDIPDDWDSVELQAPIPTDPLTLLVFEENRKDPSNHRGWPSTGSEYATPAQLFEARNARICESYRAWQIRNNKNWLGYLGANLACDIIPVAYSLAEAEHEVELAQSAHAVCATRLLHHRVIFPASVTASQLNHLSNKITLYEATYGEAPPFEELLEMGKRCGIKWETPADQDNLIPTKDLDRQLSKLEAEFQKTHRFDPAAYP